jgi:hypothetical protein
MSIGKRDAAVKFQVRCIVSVTPIFGRLPMPDSLEALVARFTPMTHAANGNYHVVRVSLLPHNRDGSGSP